MGVSRGPSIERVNVGPFRDDVAGNFTDATRRGARRFLRPPCRTGMLSSAGANTEDAPNWRDARFPKPLVGGSSPPGTANLSKGLGEAF